MTVPRLAVAPTAFGTLAGVQFAATPQLPLALRFHVWAEAAVAQTNASRSNGSVCRQFVRPAYNEGRKPACEEKIAVSLTYYYPMLPVRRSQLHGVETEIASKPQTSK